MKTENHGNCKTCGGCLLGKRPDAQYCNEHCYNTRKRFAGATERLCKRENCGVIFPLRDRSDANRKYCSDACAKLVNSKRIKQWTDEQPEGFRSEYYARATAKNPGQWVAKHRRNRTEALALLGGECAVPDCGVSNPHWLHIDFIPTTRGTPYRHSRGIGYIRRHKDLFRLLCANHHYELTLTGKIEGSTITQLRLVPGTKKETLAA